MEQFIVEPQLSGWRRIRDFQPDPTVNYYLVIPVGRPLDIARYCAGKFVEFEHDEWELDVLYYMPIPKEPQEMIQWFYGEPNGYRLRIRPPWRLEEEWNETLRQEQDVKEQLERQAPVGSRMTFRNISQNKILTGIVDSVSSVGYVVQVEEDSLWCVAPDSVLMVIQP